MTIENVVRKVVEEVVSRLNPPTESRIVVLAKPDDENVADLRQVLGDDIEIGVGIDVTSAARVIIPLLSCTQMADLAVGRATSYRFQQVLSRLLSGKPVEVFEFEYPRFKTTAPQPLYAQYETYRQTLDSFGLIDMVVATKASGSLFPNAVVVEEDILTAQKQGLRTLQLAATTLVTPLAYDRAKACGILLEKNERHDT